MEIKLQVGFFKTRRYSLTMGHKRIFLTPHDAGPEKYIIDDKELVYIVVFKKNRQIVELEIVTQNSVNKHIYAS